MLVACASFLTKCEYLDRGPREWALNTKAHPRVWITLRLFDMLKGMLGPLSDLRENIGIKRRKRPVEGVRDRCGKSTPKTLPRSPSNKVPKS